METSPASPDDEPSPAAASSPPAGGADAAASAVASAAPPPAAGAAAVLAEMAWLRRLARSLTADPSVADDLVQETWLAAMRSPPREDGPLRPWLSRVLRNFARQRRRADGRRRAREERRGPGADAPSAADLVERVEMQRLLAGMVLDLEEPYRSTVLLRYYEDLPGDVIARRQGVAASTVRVRVRRALERLRERLDRRFGGDRKAWCLLLLRLEPEAAAIPAAPAGGTAAGGAVGPRGGAASAPPGVAGATGRTAVHVALGAGILLAAAGGTAILARGGGGGGSPSGASAAALARTGGATATRWGAAGGEAGPGAPGVALVVECDPDAERDGAADGDGASAGEHAATEGPDTAVDGAPRAGGAGARTAGAGAGVGAGAGGSADRTAPVAAPEGADGGGGATASDDAGRLAGLVLDGEGRPVEGAEVVAAPPRPRRELPPADRWDELPARGPAPLASARTDAGGRFALRGVPAAAVEIAASATGPGEARALLPAGPRPPGGAELRLVLAAAPAASGLVVDGSGAPVAGVPLALWPEGGDAAATFAVSDAAGAFRLPAPGSGACALVAAPPGLARAVIREVPAGADALLVAVGGPATVEGRVLHADGSAAAGARVVIARVAAEGFHAAVAADADGHYRLTGLPVGPAGVFLVEAGGLRAHPEGCDALDPTGGGSLILVPGVTRRDVVLGGGAAVAGRLAGPGGAPPAGVRVTVLARGAGGERVAIDGAVDAEGAFQVTGVPGGTAVVVAAGPGWASLAEVGAAVAWLGGDDGAAAAAGGVFDLREGSTVHLVAAGTVEEPVGGVVLGGDGAPVAEARVRLVPGGGSAGADALLVRAAALDREVRTAVDGRFLLPGPPRGLLLRIEATGAGAPPARSAPFRSGLPAPAGGHVVVLPAARRLTGMVRRADGEAVAGATVRAAAGAATLAGPAADAALAAGHPAETDAAGAFALEGDFDDPLVEASAAGHQAARVAPGDTAREGPVVVVLEPYPAVAGRAVDGAGRGVAGAAVLAHPADGAPRATVAGADGVFRFERIGLAAVRVRAEAPGRRAAEAVVAAGREDVVLVLVDEATLRCRVLLPDGRAAAGALVGVVQAGVRRSATAGEDGSVAFAGLDPGAATLEVAWSGGPPRPAVLAAMAPVTLRAGENALTLRLVAPWR